MNRWLSGVTLAIGVGAVALAFQAPPVDTLDIYWVDVEGGAATLIVTPARESILMDAGWRRTDQRDAERIQAAMADAQISRIDYFIASHFHGDHVGGLPALAKRAEIGQFIDHGDSVEQDYPESKEAWDLYLSVAAGNRRTIQPGDTLPLRGLEFTFVTAHGHTLEDALESRRPNVHCAGVSPGEDDTRENSRSVGYLLSLGAFRFLNLGDLTVNVQHELACPENELGVVDVYQVPHHGNGVAPQLTWALSPTVAVGTNGPHKGGSAEGFAVVAETPGIEDIWQAHRALDTDDDHNTAERLTANITDEDGCLGYWIKATVRPDGRSYVVTNGRTGESRSYVSK